MEKKPALLQEQDINLVRRRLTIHYGMDTTLATLLCDIDCNLAEALAFGLAVYFSRELRREISMSDLTTAMIGNLLVEARKPKRVGKVIRAARDAVVAVAAVAAGGEVAAVAEVEAADAVSEQRSSGSDEGMQHSYPCYEPRYTEGRKKKRTVNQWFLFSRLRCFSEVFDILNKAGKFGAEPLEGEEMAAVEGGRVIPALHALFDQICGYLSGTLRISNLTSMISGPQAAGGAEKVSVHKMTFADVKECVRRMALDHAEGGVEFAFDLDNLASLDIISMIMEQGWAKRMTYSEDKRIRYNYMKRLTGGDKLALDISGSELAPKEAAKTKAGIVREVCVWVWTIFFLSWETMTPATHKGAGKKFSNHATCADYDTVMARLAALPGLTDKAMRDLADDSVGRVIRLMNVIPDGLYSAESSKSHPFSLREALIIEKEELKKIVASEGRVIGAISEACGGVKGGGVAGAAAAASAKNTPYKGGGGGGRGVKTPESTILDLQNQLHQSQDYNKRLKYDLDSETRHYRSGGRGGGGGGGSGGGGGGSGGRGAMVTFRPGQRSPPPTSSLKPNRNCRAPGCKVGSLCSRCK